MDPVPEPKVFTNTFAERSVWITSPAGQINLGDLRRAVAAAEKLSDDSVVRVKTGSVGSDATYASRIDINEVLGFGDGIVDVEVRRESL